VRCFSRPPDGGHPTPLLFAQRSKKHHSAWILSSSLWISARLSF
jgi:hypothetical protein